MFLIFIKSAPPRRGGALRHLFPDVLFMRRRDFIDESFRLFPGKPAVSGLREYFHVEFISFLSQPVKPGGQLYVDVSLYPVPEVRVGFLKQRPVGLPADEVVVLIFPAFPRRVSRGISHRGALPSVRRPCMRFRRREG